jgi:hypothetical protein
VLHEELIASATVRYGVGLGLLLLGENSRDSPRVLLSATIKPLSRDMMVWMSKICLVSYMLRETAITTSGRGR